MSLPDRATFDQCITVLTALVRPDGAPVMDNDDLPKGAEPAVLAFFRADRDAADRLAIMTALAVALAQMVDLEDPTRAIQLLVHRANETE